MLSDPLAISISSTPRTIIHDRYLGCLALSGKSEKLYLYIKRQFLEAHLYRKDRLIEKIFSPQIQGGLQGEIESQALIHLVNKVEQHGLFALYNPQATDKKVTLLPAPPAGSYLEEYTLSYIEAPLPNTNLFCRPNLSKALEKGLKKFGLVSLINEEGVYCPTGKTELAKVYFYAQRELYSQALWLRGEKEWFIEQGLKEFSQKVRQDWQEWLSTHSHWLIVIDGLSHISLLRKLGLIELAQKKQGKLIVTSRDKAHDSAIHQIPVNLFSSEESKNYLLQVTHHKDEHSVEEAEKIGQALGGVPSSLKKAAEWLNDNTWPLKVYFAKQAANLAEHKAYLEARSNLTPPNEYFTGREADLVALEETLTQGKPLVLAAQVGLGGVGKTQLALQYAYRTAPQYNFIWWLNAASEAALLQSYSNLAEKLHIFLTKEEEKEDKALVKKVHRYLKGNPGWLLIFDDAENASTLNSWLPESGGHLLITSRKPNWPNAHVFTLGVFKREESIELILKITHLEDQKEEAGKLADLLQNLPLAISQAAFYIKETHISIKEYREKFEQHYKVLWEFEVPPDIYQATVQVTWHVSMQKIRQDEAREKESNECPSLVDPLMQFCAYLSSHGIPRDLLKEWVIKLYQSETPLLDINHTIDLLRRYSMIEVNAEAINVHSLVQLVTRDQLKEEEQRKACGKGLGFFYESFKYDQANLDKANDNYRLIVHVENIATHAEQLEIEREMALTLRDRVGHHYINCRGAYEAAKKTWEHCLKKSIIWKANLYIADFENKVGRADLGLGHYEEAKKRFAKALEIYAGIDDIPPPFIAGIYNNLGNLQKDLGQYAEARKTYEKARLILYEKDSFVESSDAADIHHSLGIILTRLGEFAKAKSYLDHAGKIYGQIYPPTNPIFIGFYNNCGNLWLDLGDYAHAEEAFRKALQCAKQAFIFSEHPDFEMIYNNLGNCLQGQGKYAKAEKFYQKALLIHEKNFSQDHPFFAAIYLNLGIVFYSLGKPQEAKESYEKCLSIFRKFSPDNSAVLAELYNNMGTAYLQLGKFSSSKKFFLKALKIFKEIYSSNHPYIAETYHNLGGIIEKSNPLQAIKYCQKAINIYKEINPLHCKLGGIYRNMGKVLSELGGKEEQQKAEKCFEKALLIQTHNFPNGHPVTASIHNELGNLLKDFGQYEKAISHYLQAINIYEKGFFSSPPYFSWDLFQLRGYFI
ncbi:tetratricopeptide repeat protein [Neochlamydia sp. AcF95]|uniref:tetratricopeptide repeat protein n=1 Tax=Neochlamydia sp. AcF95 TaxID=2795734 RepID=UPI001BC94CEF|nr:tetratricopeptide repeat protein [Neochlamydia sp. AcF95]MBS4170160.1 hypothetical protein [Neochlamydia sp. AcF95]